MLVFICICSAILFIFCCLLGITVVYLHDKIKQLKSMQGDHNIMICKLMYHVSKDIEDFETTEELKKRLGKQINFYKFLE